MKKQLFYIIFLGIASQGCEECESKGKVYTTVTKTIDLSFNFNHTGTSTSSANLTSFQIANLFAKEVKGELSGVDVKSIMLYGDINTQQNTATEATVSAKIFDVGLLGTESPLLNSTKMLKNGDGDFGANFSSAVYSLHAQGIGIFKKYLGQWYYGSSILLPPPSLKVDLTATVPTNQRLVGTINMRITASVTYYTCEVVIFTHLDNACD